MDGKIFFSTRHEETCYEYGVKFLNQYHRIFHNQPRSYFVEIISYLLVSHGIR